jgi:hypothetical protein
MEFVVYAAIVAGVVLLAYGVGYCRRLEKQNSDYDYQIGRLKDEILRLKDQLRGAPKQLGRVDSAERPFSHSVLLGADRH